MVLAFNEHSVHYKQSLLLKKASSNYDHNYDKFSQLQQQQQLPKIVYIYQSTKELSFFLQEEFILYK